MLNEPFLQYFLHLSLNFIFHARRESIRPDVNRLSTRDQRNIVITRPAGR
jgi:hypothetical protein